MRGPAAICQNDETVYDDRIVNAESEKTTAAFGWYQNGTVRGWILLYMADFLSQITLNLSKFL